MYKKQISTKEGASPNILTVIDTCVHNNITNETLRYIPMHIMIQTLAYLDWKEER